MPKRNKPLQPAQIEAYVRQTTQLLDLPIPPEQMADVVENFEQVHTIVQQVLEFPLPDDLEVAPRFEP